MLPTERTSAPQRRLAPHPTLIRWATLIQIHGSQTAALEALLHDADQLQKLKRAVRAMGVKPELLLAE